MNTLELAEEAGLGRERWNTEKQLHDFLDRFAALVAAHEKKFWMEQIEVECNEAVLAEREAFAKESLEVLDNLRKETIAQCQQGMIEAYKLGQSEEREACAKVCDDRADGALHAAEFAGRNAVVASEEATECAAAIRGRIEK